MSRHTLLNGGDLLARGVSNLATLRPILAGNEELTLASHATLRKDEWETIDERVNEVLRERLTVLDDLRDRGLVQPVSLGTILRVTERLEDFDEAEVSFDGDAAPRRDRPSFLKDVRPVPVIHKDFQIPWRQLEASRERGEPLDMTAAEQATRKVRDRIQALITLGKTAGGPEGGGIPGLTTAANRIQVSLANVWDGASGDPRADALRMLEAAYANNLHGPFGLYVPKNYWATIQDDYNENKGDRTHLERLLAFEDVEFVHPLDALPDDNVILLQLTRDVIDYSEAQAVTTVQWQKNPFVTNFRVLAVGGPQIKTQETDADTSVNGIIHLS